VRKDCSRRIRTRSSMRMVPLRISADPEVGISRVVRSSFLQLELQLAQTAGGPHRVDGRERGRAHARGLMKAVWPERPMSRLIPERSKPAARRGAVFGKIVQGGEVKCI